MEIEKLKDVLTMALIVLIGCKKKLQLSKGI
jgi:hypothetical protein